MLFFYLTPGNRTPLKIMKKIYSLVFIFIFAFNLNAQAGTTIVCSYVGNSAEKSKIRISGNNANEITALGLKISYSSVTYNNSAYTLKGSSGAVNQKRSWVINPTRGIGKLVIMEDQAYIYDYNCN